MKQLLSLFITSVLIFSCTGEAGEPGPAGEPGAAGAAGTNGQNGLGFEKNGFIEGAVAGKRRDGTIFSEPFKYEYSYGQEAFSFDEYSGKDVFEVSRSLTPNEGGNYIGMTLEVLNKGTSIEVLGVLNHPSYTPLNIQFSKELSANTLFVVKANAETVEEEFVYPVNPTDNTATYKFSLRENGNYNPTTFYDASLQETFYIFTTSDGKRVFYEDPYTNLDAALGYYYGNIYKVVNANGSIAPTAPYDQLRLSQPSSYLIFRNNSGVNLSSTITLPGDTFTITNYVKNATTGVITFDFFTKIGTLGRYNTTLNPLTVSGKYNSGKKVYANVVNRIGG